jgi:hypothetical protein
MSTFSQVTPSTSPDSGFVSNSSVSQVGASASPILGTPPPPPPPGFASSCPPGPLPPRYSPLFAPGEIFFSPAEGYPVEASRVQSNSGAVGLSSGRDEDVDLEDGEVDDTDSSESTESAITLPSSPPNSCTLVFAEIA